MLQKIQVAGKTGYLYQKKQTDDSDVINPHKKVCILQLVADYDENQLPMEIQIINSLLVGDEGTVGTDYVFTALKIDKPYTELSPWKNPPIFGTENFGEGAKITLQFILDEFLPVINSICKLDVQNTEYIIGGYSLTALFALWVGYESDRFSGIAAASPSVWFPGWEEYIAQHDCQAKRVYLSLGDHESHTKNEVLKSVEERIRQQYKSLTAQLDKDNCFLEWNQGNHFKDSNMRTAKAFVWNMK